MRIIQKIGTIIFVIGVSIAFLGLKVKNFSLYFFLTGGAMSLVGFLLVFLLGKKEEKEIQNEFESWKNELIRNGIKIKVDLSKVEIKASNYREEIIDEDAIFNKYKGLDNLAGYETRQFADVNQSILVYEAEVLGNKKTFYSPIIYKDEITLQFLVSNHKQTTIYVNRLNKEDYFFDIDFLDS